MTSSFIRLGVFTALAFGAVSCNNGGNTASSTASDPGLASLNKDSLASDIRVLASDSFQGRRPFTEGEKRTLNYLTSSYAALGLEPGNGNSYTQDVPLVEITPVGTPSMQVRNAAGATTLQNIQDFVMWTERPDTSVKVENAPVVFAGFGIVAPEYNWNDYAGLDVKGKVVVVMVNDPGFYDSSLFKGHTMTYYGRWTYKYEEAARQGAAACVIVHTTKAASYPFSVVQNSNSGVKLHLDNRGSADYQIALRSWVTEDIGKKLLKLGGKDSSLFEAAKHKGFKPVALDLKWSASLQVHEIYNVSHNVIAKITGTKKPDEYVIYSAHWDHFGIGKPDDKGDSIYHGALDNASGTASILEIARAFKNSPEKPERTIVFLSVTAEEQGLLGSAYYAQHPVYPLAKTVADLNIDGVNAIGPTKDITYSGMGQSQLEDVLQDITKSEGRYVSPEDEPGAGHFFRSDHFSFAKGGVPSITTDAGIDNVEKGKEYGKKMKEDYTEKRYHQPGDKYDPATWNLDGGIQDLGILYLIGKKLAFSDTWLEWKPGSEFKAIRDKTADERK